MVVNAIGTKRRNIEIVLQSHLSLSLYVCFSLILSLSLSTEKARERKRESNYVREVILVRIAFCAMHTCVCIQLVYCAFAIAIA